MKRLLAPLWLLLALGGPLCAQDKDKPTILTAETRVNELEARVKHLESEIAELKSALRSRLEAGIRQLESDKNLLSKLDKSKNQEPSTNPSARPDSSGPRQAPRAPDEDRARYMALSDMGKQKLREKMVESRDKMMNASPEERMKFMKEVFDRVEAEDKAQRAGSSPQTTPDPKPLPEAPAGKSQP